MKLIIHLLCMALIGAAMASGGIFFWDVEYWVILLATSIVYLNA